MTPEQQTKVRIAIAEWRGWVDVHELSASPDGQRWRFQTTEPNGFPDESYEKGSIVGRERVRALLSHVPDYYNDLNACHEAEKGLTQVQQDRYAHLLTRMTSCERAARWHISHATAEQRAEALYRTIKGEAP